MQIKINEYQHFNSNYLRQAEQVRNCSPASFVLSVWEATQEASKEIA